MATGHSSSLDLENEQLIDDMAQCALDRGMGKYFLRGYIRYIDAGTMISFCCGTELATGKDGPAGRRSRINKFIENDAVLTVPTRLEPVSAPDGFDLLLLPQVVEKELGIILHDDDWDQFIKRAVPAVSIGLPRTFSKLSDGGGASASSSGKTRQTCGP